MREAPPCDRAIDPTAASTVLEVRPEPSGVAGTKAPEHRRNNIDALRLILALLVLFSHSYPLGLGTEDSEPLKWFSRGQMTLGTLAVDCFFILSGYLVSQSWERSRGTWSFLKKRASRIYPGYIVAVAFCVWVVVPLASPDGAAAYSWATLLENSWRMLLMRGFVAPAAFATNPARYAVNGSLWSLPFEFWCYIGVLVLGWTTLMRRGRWLLGLFAATILLHFVFEWRDWSSGAKVLGVIFGVPRIWARLLPLYLAGVVAYRYRARLALHGRGALAALLGFAVASKVPYGLVFAMPTLGAYLLLYLAFTSEWRWHNAAARGDFSYGIYLYAFPVQQLIVHTIGHKVDPYFLFALATPPTLVCGVLSWYLVERRFLRRAHDPS
jgi:peptidoglycan/LPS O-acetylase OafA/YrhL